MRNPLWVLLLSCLIMGLSACSSSQPQIAENNLPTVPTSTTLNPSTQSTLPVNSISHSNTPFSSTPSDEIPTTIIQLVSETSEIIDPATTFHEPQMLDCHNDGCIFTAFQPFLRPLPSGYDPTVEKTYRYGSTQNGNKESHAGVEFPSEMGTPVIAAENGIVFYAGDDQNTAFGPIKNFYGNLIILEHHWDGLDQPVYTLYAHLSQINIKTGDEVTAGQIIGEVGKSGTAAGAHLHFEVRVNGTSPGNTVNPELWLKPAASDDENKDDICGTLVVRFKKGEGTIYSNPVLIENFTDTQIERKPYIDAESYAFDVPTDVFWNENLVIGDLAPGIYRISTVYDNLPYKFLVDIISERITLVEFDFDKK